MSDLISRSELLDKFESMRDNSKTLNRLSRSVGKTIAEITYQAITLCMNVLKEAHAVDAVPVVRCKDCKRYSGHRYCWYLAADVMDDDFCSYGERKTK